MLKKYNTHGWQGREDYIKLNTKAIYIPNYTFSSLLKDIERVDIYYDKEAKVISLVPHQDGTRIRKLKRQAQIGTSLARVMPRGWYVWKEDLIFVFSKAYVAK